MWKIFCDESRVTACKYILIGALTVPTHSDVSLRMADTEFRDRTRNNKAHFKWEKACGRKKLPDYLQLVDIFFEHDIHFKAVVIEHCKVDYARYHKEDRELGFYKFYFLLLSRLVNFDQQYIIKIHRRSDEGRGRLIDLQGATNNYCRKMKGRYVTPVASLEAVEFERFTELQIVDVLLGAIGYHWERCHLRNDASKSKIEICNHICKRLDKPSLEFESDWRERKFNVWKWKPKA
jgi:hypothetical protein